MILRGFGVVGCRHDSSQSTWQTPIHLSVSAQCPCQCAGLLLNSLLCEVEASLGDVVLAAATPQVPKEDANRPAGLQRQDREGQWATRFAVLEIRRLVMRLFGIYTDSAKCAVGCVVPTTHQVALMLEPQEECHFTLRRSCRRIACN